MEVCRRHGNVELENAQPTWVKSVSHVSVVGVQRICQPVR